MRKSIVVEELGRGGPYSHAIVAGDMVYISGQTGYNGSNKTDFKSQFKIAMGNIEKIAKSAGFSLTDIVKLGVYIIDKSYFNEMNTVFGEYFKELPPARTTLVTGFVADNILVELEATLYR
jgi:2-iminobutanoate/2-iminopropanoate deaminase